MGSLRLSRGDYVLAWIGLGVIAVLSLMIVDKVPQPWSGLVALLMLLGVPGLGLLCLMARLNDIGWGVVGFIVILIAAALTFGLAWLVIPLMPTDWQRERDLLKAAQLRQARQMLAGNEGCSPHGRG